jgi:acyl dehydratase
MDDARSPEPAGGEWRLDRLGRWSDPVTLHATRERIAAYAAATGDEHPAHRCGDLAPPVFPVVGAVIDAISPSIMAVASRELAMRVVHGEHELRYHRPITPGMTLISRGAATGIHGVSTGVVVIGTGTTETATGELVVEQQVAAFFRGARLDVNEGQSLTQHAFDESVRTEERAVRVTHTFDADQTVRYAAASGDHMPIHLDDAIARAAGLPGVIVHGLCTMAFCSRAVVQTECPEDPTRLRCLAVRFAHVVQPGETVTHTLWRAREPGRILFETVSQSGAVVIRDGLAELDRASS